MAILTKHAEQRMLERCDRPKGVRKKNLRKSMKKIVDRAFEEGICHSECSGELRTYLDGQFLSHKSANNMRVFNQNVYIFQGRALITVLNVPNYLSEIVSNLHAELGVGVKRGDSQGGRIPIHKWVRESGMSEKKQKYLVSVTGTSRSKGLGLPIKYLQHLILGQSDYRQPEFKNMSVIKMREIIDEFRRYNPEHARQIKEVYDIVKEYHPSQEVKDTCRKIRQGMNEISSSASGL